MTAQRTSLMAVRPTARMISFKTVLVTHFRPLFTALKAVWERKVLGVRDH